MGQLGYRKQGILAGWPYYTEPLTVCLVSYFHIFQKVTYRQPLAPQVTVRHKFQTCGDMGQILSDFIKLFRSESPYVTMVRSKFIIR